MNRAFYNLSKTDQKKILDSAYQVFTDTPYDQASTNDIVKRAGISKGRLFYYFTNKLSLFHFLIDHAIEFVKTEYLSKLSFVERDFLSRYQKISLIKKASYEKEPHLYAFLSYVYIHETNQIPKARLDLMRTMVNKTLDAQYNDIDVSLFRDDINPKKVMELLVYSLEGYQKKLIETFKEINIKEESMGKYYDEYDEFLKLLRKIYYK